MKFVSGHLISGADIATGLMVVSAFAAWAALAVWAVLSLRRAGDGALKGALWGGGLVLGGVLLVSLILDRVLTGDAVAERRAIEARASELVARAIAPGSALPCLDALASTPVETACEKALFATSESVAAALAYVNAQVSLLAAGSNLAERDPSYRPAFERLRRGIEEDRYGLVAQVLSTRGCNTPDCADFAVLRDNKRILVNMKRQTFANHVQAHALAWNPDGAAPALASAPNGKMPAEAVAETSAGSATPGATRRSRYDYPSADSIPPVSIMEAEKDPPPAAEPKTEPQKHAAPRARPARDRPPAGAQPPIVIVPSTQAQTSGTR